MTTLGRDSWASPSPELSSDLRDVAEGLAREFFEKWNQNLRGEDLYNSLREKRDQPPVKGLITTTWIPQELLSSYHETC